MRLVLATRNEHKLRELGRAAGRRRARAAARRTSTLPPEDGDTFAANALGKARAAAAALGRAGDRRRLRHRGRGARRRARASARRASPARDATDAENLAKLRAEAPAGIAPALRLRDGVRRAGRRGARRSRAPARARSPRDRAASGGFGYDPAFLPDDIADGRTMAELVRRGEGRDLATAAAPPARCAHGSRRAMTRARRGR